MLVALQQQHARLLDGQRESRDLLESLANRPVDHHTPPPPPDLERDNAARQGVEDLLHRILNALGVQARPPPPSESSDDDFGSDILRRRLRQIKRSPIVEPVPIRPSSELNLEEWASYTESEVAPAPPPTVDVISPVTIVDVPPRRARARSASPASTLERIGESLAEQEEDVFSPVGRPVFQQGLRTDMQGPPTPRRDWRYEDAPLGDSSGSSGGDAPPPPLSRRSMNDPALDFLNLVRDHRKARRGGDGTFIPGPQPVVRPHSHETERVLLTYTIIRSLRGDHQLPLQI